jgi:branched-subunit amino acid aminotransferase/4-amino-4-deoxychorismate lyase
MDEPLAYLNGRFLPASQATIPLADTGFVLGATVAEQIRTFAGEPFRLDDHLARLERSLEIIGVKPDLGAAELAVVARKLAAGNHRLQDPHDDLGLSVLVTPGVYPAYAPSESTWPTVCLHTYPLPFRLWHRKYETGQALVTTDVEQVSPKSWPPALKCRSRMHYYLADRRAEEIEPGARALLLDCNGLVTEASTANLVIAESAGRLVSPPHAKVLPGISLAQVVALAGELGMETFERDLTVDDVGAAEEVFLTSTPLCLLPVTRLNGRPIADGTPGPIFRRLLGAWSRQVGIDVPGQARRFAGR